MVIVYRAALVLVLGLGIDIILYLDVYLVCIPWSNSGTVCGR